MKACKPVAIFGWLACEASVSVWFRSKERGTRVKNRAKNGASKRVGEGVGKIGRKHWRVNLADKNKQQPQEDTSHVPYMTYQYETNLWSTHVNIVRLAEPIRRYVRWWTQVFKFEGLVCKRFLPSFAHPPPPPLLIYCSRAVKTENPVPRSFFAPKLNGDVCYADYWMIKLGNLPQFQNVFCHMTYFTYISWKSVRFPSLCLFRFLVN